jgi:hypothetical protein
MDMMEPSFKITIRSFTRYRRSLSPVQQRISNLLADHTLSSSQVKEAIIFAIDPNAIPASNNMRLFKYHFCDLLDDAGRNTTV